MTPSTGIKPPQQRHQNLNKAMSRIRTQPSVTEFRPGVPTKRMYNYVCWDPTYMIILECYSAGYMRIFNRASGLDLQQSVHAVYTGAINSESAWVSDFELLLMLLRSSRACISLLQDFRVPFKARVRSIGAWLPCSLSGHAHLPGILEGYWVGGYWPHI